MTLRGRLLTYSLVQVFALGLVTFGAGLFMRAHLAPLLDDYLRRKTERTTLGLADGLVVALGGNEPELAQATIAILADDPDLVRFEVRDRKGTLLASVGRGTLPAATGTTDARLRDAGDVLVSTAPIEMEGYQLGTLTGAFSKSRLRAILDGFLVAAAAVALACLVAVAVAFRFSRSFVAPIHRMIQFSHRVRDGGLSERVAASPREGELSQLAADLNAMAEALEARDAALAQRGRELEKSLVALRTTQEELLRSTRLASVGEMAGRTAHEVLNPMTGIQCRVALMQRREAEAMEPNIETLREIARAWRAAYAEGGLDGLARSLAQPAAGAAPLVEEDLDNLDGIAGYLADSHRERAGDLTFLLREGDRVVHIVDGMRSLTRATGAPARAQVAELLRESIESMSDAATKRNVGLRVAGDANAEVMVDRYEFVQIVTNLLRNACLAIEEKNGRAGGQVTIATEVGADLVAVRVQDDGCGIAEASVPRLFEGSFTTRSSRDGTGLGLGIARRLARGFGGELRLERSAVGQGATFLLEIPIARTQRGVNIDAQ
jgi:signal transduction histidine kinase